MVFGARVKVEGRMKLAARSSSHEVIITMSPETHSGDTPTLRDPQLKLVPVNAEGKEFLYSFIASRMLDGLDGHEIFTPNNIPFKLKIYD